MQTSKATTLAEVEAFVENNDLLQTRITTLKRGDPTPAETAANEAVVNAHAALEQALKHLKSLKDERTTLLTTLQEQQLVQFRALFPGCNLQRDLPWLLWWYRGGRDDEHRFERNPDHLPPKSVPSYHDGTRLYNGPKPLLRWDETKSMIYSHDVPAGGRFDTPEAEAAFRTLYPPPPSKPPPPAKRARRA